MTGIEARTRAAYGDWQTPLDLARAVLARIERLDLPAPSVVIEPTCGEGTFLEAAAVAYPSASLQGYEINPTYAEAARDRLRLSERRACVIVADAFALDWERELAQSSGHVLLIGNPPWVTSSAQGATGATNLPRKHNFKGHAGLDARTGKGNFDVSEWMILRWLEALRVRPATLAVLCKSAVARRVIEHGESRAWRLAPRGLFRVDAGRYFRAAVDAVLFVCETGRPSDHSSTWPLYDELQATSPRAAMAVVDGRLVPDAAAFARTAHLEGGGGPAWRSGVKHDCAEVMELERVDAAWWNALGEPVDVEPSCVFPLLKGSDVAHGRAPRRGLVVPQRKIGEATARLREEAPRLWSYLTSHRERLAARRSTIYRGQPDFAIFGIGPYSFAPWKVAVSGLHKRAAFRLVPPHDGLPVLLDDTCYFLPFTDEASARRAHAALASELAAEFLAARVFVDAKRPIQKGVLGRLDLAALERACLSDPGTTAR
jgi:hypothetical protein